MAEEQDDATVMMSAMPEERPAFGGEDGNEATMMMTPPSEDMQDAATVRMGPEQSAALAQAVAAKRAAQQRAGAPAPAAGGWAAGATAAPQAAPAPGVSVLMILGGVGALVLATGMTFALLFPQLQGMPRDLVETGNYLAASGYIVLALGLLGSSSRVGGVSVAAAVFAILAGAWVLLEVLGVVEARTPMMLLISMGVQALAWLLLGVWGFAAMSTAGIGVVGGILGVITGLAMILLGLMFFIGFGGRDLGEIVYLVVGCGTAGAALFTAITMFVGCAKGPTTTYYAS